MMLRIRMLLDFLSEEQVSLYTKKIQELIMDYSLQDCSSTPGVNATAICEGNELEVCTVHT